MTIERNSPRPPFGIFTNPNAPNKIVDQLSLAFSQEQSGELKPKEALKPSTATASFFRAADTNGNGGVSKQELLQIIDSTEILLPHRNAALAELPAAIASANSSQIDQLLSAQNSNDRENLIMLLEELLNQNTTEQTRKNSAQESTVNTRAL